MRDTSCVLPYTTLPSPRSGAVCLSSHDVVQDGTYSGSFGDSGARQEDDLGGSCDNDNEGDQVGLHGDSVALVFIYVVDFVADQLTLGQSGA